MKAKRVSKAQVDRISTLPETITETILCLLPIEQAARTSILSNEWRYKWTKIPKLKFFENTVSKTSTTKKQDSEQSPDVASARKNMDRRCKLFYAIHQVLLLHQGPIREFALWINADKTCVEIDQIILHLSRNHTLKKFKFESDYDHDLYELPSSLFLLQHLTELHLGFCDYKLKRVVRGFSNLTSLSLHYVRFSKESFLHLLSNSPSLKKFCLCMGEEYFIGRKYPSVMEIFKCLPMIEQLTISGYTLPSLVQASVPEELQASLIHLKYCCIDQISVANAYELTFLAVLIKCSPNLEKIHLLINTEAGFDENSEEYSVTLEENSDVCLEHLNELKVEDFRNYKPELELVKFILARSPNLKKVILVTYMCDKNEQLELLKVLSHSTCVSPPVEFIIKNSS